MAQTNQLSYHQDPNLGLLLAHPNIFPILLKYVKGLVLRSNNYSISMAQSNNTRMRGVRVL